MIWQAFPMWAARCFASAACMDKEYAHCVLQYNGINMAKSRPVKQSDLNNLDAVCEKIAAELKYPLFVKPACSG